MGSKPVPTHHRPLHDQNTEVSVKPDYSGKWLTMERRPEKDTMGLCKKEDIATFKAEISGHAVAINLLVATAQLSVPVSHNNPKC